MAAYAPLLAEVSDDGNFTAINYGTVKLVASANILPWNKDTANILAEITVKIPAVNEFVSLEAEADAGVQSWRHEKKYNYGGRNYLILKYNSKFYDDEYNEWFYCVNDENENDSDNQTDLKVGYMRFDLSETDISYGIKKAEILLKSEDELNANSIELYGVDNTEWIEGRNSGAAVKNDGTEGISFYNRPYIGAFLTADGNKTTEGFFSIDISEYVRKNFKSGKISIGMASAKSNGKN